jgi:hypothetical protein
MLGWIKAEIAAALFFGLSSASLALELIRDNPHRLKTFLAYPHGEHSQRPLHAWRLRTRSSPAGPKSTL